MLPWMMALAYAPSVDGGDPSATPIMVEFKVTDAKPAGAPEDPFGLIELPVAALTWRTHNVNDALYEWVVFCAVQPVQTSEWMWQFPPPAPYVEIGAAACSAGAFNHTLTRGKTPSTYHAHYSMQLRRLADGTFVDNPDNTAFSSKLFGYFDYTRQIPELGKAL